MIENSDDDFYDFVKQFRPLMRRLSKTVGDAEELEQEVLIQIYILKTSDNKWNQIVNKYDYIRKFISRTAYHYYLYKKRYYDDLECIDKKGISNFSDDCDYKKKLENQVEFIENYTSLEKITEKITNDITKYEKEILNFFYENLEPQEIAQMLNTDLLEIRIFCNIEKIKRYYRLENYLRN